MKATYYYLVWDHETAEEVPEHVERGSNNGGNVVIWGDGCSHHPVECEVHYGKVHEE